MLPCIHEGVPSQESENLQQSAIDTLISRCGQKAVPLPHNGAAFSPLPDAKGALANASSPIESQQLKGKGPFRLGTIKDNSAFQSNFPDQSKTASAFRFNSRAPIDGSGSVSASPSERLCFCSDLQHYIQSHVLFPSLPPSPISGNLAAPPQHLDLFHLFFIPCFVSLSAASHSVPCSASHSAAAHSVPCSVLLSALGCLGCLCCPTVQAISLVIPASVVGLVCWQRHCHLSLHL